MECIFTLYDKASKKDIAKAILDAPCTDKQIRDYVNTITVKADSYCKFCFSNFLAFCDIIPSTGCVEKDITLKIEYKNNWFAKAQNHFARITQNYKSEQKAMYVIRPIAVIYSNHQGEYTVIPWVIYKHDNVPFNPIQEAK